MVEALNSGLVFAFDIKDTTNILFDVDVVECGEVLAHGARDLLLSYLAEHGVFRKLPPRDLLNYSTEHLCNFRFFRFAGNRSGSANVTYEVLLEHPASESKS